MVMQSDLIYISMTSTRKGKKKKKRKTKKFNRAALKYITYNIRCAS